MKGTVKRIVPPRRRGLREDGGGYFFILDEEDNDRFAHANDLRNAELSALRVGDPVEFDPVSEDRSGHNRNGLRAERVRRVA
jgi:cold shock CspA family protein